MPSLSFCAGDNSKPLAIVRGGNDAGKVLYLHEGTTSPQKKAFNKTKYANMLKAKPIDKTKIFIRLEEALKKDVPVEKLIEPDNIKKIYEEILKDCVTNKSVELDDSGQFELLSTCDPNKRQLWYICGMSGSGKSYVAKQLTESYHKLFPSRGIYLVSKLQEDATLDQLNYIKRVPIESFVEDYPSIDEFKDAFIIFDDIDALDPKIHKIIMNVIDDIAVTGRHSNTTLLYLSHHLTNYKKTRLLLNEADHIVVYPSSTSFHALRYLLMSYVGIDADDVKRLKKTQSRWLCFSKLYPPVVIHQRGAELLNN